MTLKNYKLKEATGDSNSHFGFTPDQVQGLVCNLRQVISPLETSIFLVKDGANQAYILESLGVLWDKVGKALTAQASALKQ